MRPTRGPGGEVWWWQRRAPRGDEALWCAVQRLQARRLALGMSVSTLARRTQLTGRPLRRETLSRVLNGSQPTSWSTVWVLADVLGLDPDEAQPDDPR